MPRIAGVDIPRDKVGRVDNKAYINKLEAAGRFK